ncbi:MAG: hypothetical protein U0269_18760 [Polyangiales bacterium]
MSLASARVFAQQSPQREPVARLELFRASEAARCPDERALRGAVARRLGRDPFSDAAQQRARLAFGPDGAGLSLSIELVARDGSTLGQRTIRTRTRDCVELAESAAVALVVAIDVLEASAEREPVPTRVAPSRPESDTAASERPSAAMSTSAPRTPTATTTATATTSTALSATRAPVDSVTGFIAINAAASVGDLPTVAFGGALRFGVRWRALGVFVEGRAVLPTLIDGPQGSRIESSLYMGSAMPCFHRGWFAACGVASFGALLARGSNVDHPREPTIAVIAVGARAAGSWRVPGDFFIDASAEVLGSLLRPTLTINGERAWEAPPLQASLRVGVGVELR